MPKAVNLDPRGAILLSTGDVGRYFGRSRIWGWRLLSAWWEEQQSGGPVRVVRKGKGSGLFTTRAVLRAEAPRVGIDEGIARRLSALEKDLEAAFVRIAELERCLGRRR